MIAMKKVASGTLPHFIAAGWENIFFGWHLGLDWSNLVPSANAKIAQDGYGLFGFFVMMLLFKGILVSPAGPAPNYDMPRLPSFKKPPERSFINPLRDRALHLP